MCTGFILLKLKSSESLRAGKGGIFDTELSIVLRPSGILSALGVTANELSNDFFPEATGEGVNAVDDWEESEK